MQFAGAVLQGTHPPARSQKLGSGLRSPSPNAQSPGRPPSVKGSLRRFAPLTDSPRPYARAYGADALV